VDAICGELPVYMTVSDIRHWFHQIGMCAEGQKTFGLRTAENWWMWRVLPMGWSHSPRIAQCICWGTLLFREDGEDDLGAQFETDSAHPPQFVPIVQGGVRVGLLSVLYDNVLIVTNSLDLTEKWTRRWKRNCEKFHVQLKHLTTTVQPNVRHKAHLPAEHLGLAIGCEKYHGRWRFVWRHSSEKAERWAPLVSEVVKRHALDVAKCVGVLLWDATVRLAPLCEQEFSIEILRKTAKAVAKEAKGWKATIVDLSMEEVTHLQEEIGIVLSKIRAVRWMYRESREGSGGMQFAASDASDEALGGLLLHDGYVGSDGNDWFAIPIQPTEIIFLRELQAAEITIRRVLLTAATIPRTLALVVDNTAAVHCLRRFYSNSAEGRKILRRILAYLTEFGVELVPIPIRGKDNIADLPSHLKSPTCATRIKATWDCIEDYFAGIGKREPVIDCYTSNRNQNARHMDADFIEIYESAIQANDD
jgi:hypothetical protein